MNASIKKFLLINLLLAITITTTLTAIGNYFLDEKDIQEHLDTLMAISALSYEALLGDNLTEDEISDIQKHLNKIPEKIQIDFPDSFLTDAPPQSYLNKFDFQVWTPYPHKRLLLQSSNTKPMNILTSKDGFSDQNIEGENWRIFKSHNDYNGVQTILAEHYDTRQELGRKIAKDDLYIMLLTFPLSGLLIWIIISRGLASLDRVAEEVANRAPNNLEAVNLQEVPEEIKPVIDELNQLFHRLHEAFEREKRFAADAAHELRTPLAAIKAQAQVALNSNSLEDKNQALIKLINSVNRGTHVVQQLLIMSRLVPEASTINDIDEVNLPKITREILAILAPQAVEKLIELEFEPEKNLPHLQGNATALGILIRNLVDNAIRYTNENGIILVKTYLRNNHIVLEVQDNGPGIPQDLRDRVFERFFRVLGNKTTGSGLGLTIVRQITELHGASIELDSPTEGTGLIVRVIFPC